jgi:parallel beta-helix repeat protein
LPGTHLLPDMSHRLTTLLLAVAFLATPLSTFAVSPGLGEGSRGSQVASLQQTLKAHGLFTGEVTGFFGSLTKQAVATFQEAYADIVLAPLNLVQGTGYYGSLTATALTADGSLATTSPTIAFSAIEPTRVAGQSTRLGWKATNATYCTASGGWAGNMPTIKSGYVITPLTTTTYTLTCGNAKESVTKSVTVTVSDEVALDFKASHVTTTPGQLSTLLWKATNATYCTPSGTWSGSPTGTASSRQVSPFTTSTYTLTCGNANKSVSKTVTIAVKGTQTPTTWTKPSLLLTSDTYGVRSGETAKITWSSKNVASCTAGGTAWSGAQQVHGTRSFTITSDQTLSLSCVGTDGSAVSREVKIRVFAPSPTPQPPATTTPATTTPAAPTTGTYYVDFASGNNLNPGTQALPWKHAPGDANATGNPAKTVLKAGDTVLFKGGVSYYGNVQVNGGGTPSAPVTLRGDGWGSGKAIIDGSEPITGFTRCTSAADCGGNSNWAQIYKAPLTAPAFLTENPELSLNLTQGDQVLVPAQSPAPQNRYYQNPDTFYSVPKENVTTTTITDSRIAPLGNALVGSYVYVWVVPNETVSRKVVRVSGSTITLSSPITPYTDRDTKYAFANVNSSQVFDAAGEYYYNLGTKTIYVWPFGGTNPSGVVRYGARPYGVDVSKFSNVTVSGFKFQKQTGDGPREGSGVQKFLLTKSENVQILNNEIALTLGSKNGAISLSAIDGLVVEGNSIHDLRDDIRGILISKSEDATVRNNELRNIARTGIAYFGVDGGRISGNTILDSYSTHGNGMSVYLGSKNITIDRNTIRNANIALTVERSSNLTLTENVFDGAGRAMYVVADWGGMTGTVSLKNNTIVNSTGGAALLLNTKSGVKYVVDRNILDGSNTSPLAGYTNNIYTRLGHFQSARYGWSFGAGERQAPLADVFVSPNGTTYAVKPAFKGYGAGR